jgi:hypothetical protein
MEGQGGAMSAARLARAQRRLMQKLADRVDRVTQVDGLFFERGSDRRHLAVSSPEPGNRGATAQGCGGAEMICRTLPQRRAAKTLDMRFWNQLFTVTVGFYADGTPGEVFIDGGKTGQDIQNAARDAAVVLSIALQHGTPHRDDPARRHARRFRRSCVDFGRNCRLHFNQYNR